MDLLSISGLITSILGLALSIWALVKADGAKRAVAKVITKSDEQRERDEARTLFAKLNDAKSAALGRREGASRAASAGRRHDADLHKLELAQDALATTPLLNNAAIADHLNAAASELDTALDSIRQAGERDGWADALATLQGIIAKVDQFDRSAGKRALQGS